MSIRKQSLNPSDQDLDQDFKVAADTPKPKQYLWVIWGGKVNFTDKFPNHGTWFEQLGVPMGFYDRVVRGRVSILPHRTLGFYNYGTSGFKHELVPVPKDVVEGFLHAYPQYKKYDKLDACGLNLNSRSVYATIKTALLHSYEVSIPTMTFLKAWTKGMSSAPHLLESNPIVKKELKGSVSRPEYKVWRGIKAGDSQEFFQKLGVPRDSIRVGTTLPLNMKRPVSWTLNENQARLFMDPRWDPIDRDYFTDDRIEDLGYEPGELLATGVLVSAVVPADKVIADLRDVDPRLLYYQGAEQEIIVQGEVTVQVHEVKDYFFGKESEEEEYNWDEEAARDYWENSAAKKKLEEDVRRQMEKTSGLEEDPIPEGFDPDEVDPDIRLDSELNQVTSAVLAIVRCLKKHGGSATYPEIRTELPYLTLSDGDRCLTLLGRLGCVEESFDPNFECRISLTEKGWLELLKYELNNSKQSSHKQTPLEPEEHYKEETNGYVTQPEKQEGAYINIPLEDLLPKQALLDKPVSWDWVERSSDLWEAVFTSQQVPYRVDFVRKFLDYNPDYGTELTTNDWEVEFRLETHKLKSDSPLYGSTPWGVTHAWNAQEVFATVLRIIKTFLEKNTNCKSLEFTAKEDNRKQLYNTLLRFATPHIPGWTTETKIIGATEHFILTKE